MSTCITCYYRKRQPDVFPCKCCSHNAHDFYVPEDTEKEKDSSSSMSTEVPVFDKRCSSCAYMTKHSDEEPCISCNNQCNWTRRVAK